MSGARPFGAARGLLRRRLLGASDDSGFSLIESVVAITIAAIVFTAMALGMIASMQAAVSARQAQQASDVLQQQMEQLRGLGYDALAMRPVDLAVNDTLPLSGCSCYDATADNTTGPDREPLALSTGGSVYPHVTSVTLNHTVYTLRTYVTTPVDNTGAEYKRITVAGSWTTRGQSHSRSLSSFVTASRSGLPLPDYKFTANTPVTACASPGATLVYGFTIKNNGARDSFTLGVSGTTAFNWSYALDNGSGSPGTYATDDSAVPNVAGVPTVGPVETNTSVTFWAVASLSGGASTGSYPTTFVAASASDPTVTQSLATTSTVAALCASNPTPSATPTPTPSATPTPPVQPTTYCTTTLPTTSTSGSVSPTVYYLANGSTNTTNTVASSLLPMAKLNPPVSTTLWDYSTDLSTSAGRYLATSGTTTATTVAWRYQFPTSSKFVGNGVVSLWAAPASGSATDSLVLTVQVNRLNSAGTVVSTLTTTTTPTGAWGCAGPKNVGISVPFGSGNGTTFSANDQIEVKVSVAGADALLAYDTTTFTSSLTLPVKSGG